MAWDHRERVLSLIKWKPFDEEGVHQKVWGNHAANLISSDSFKDFIALNLGYFFLNSLSQSLFNTLVLA